MMNRYRITYVNPAFAPRPSVFVTDVYNRTEAVRAFRERHNQANVIQTIGDRGVVKVERAVSVIDGRTPHGRTEWREERESC